MAAYRAWLVAEHDLRLGAEAQAAHAAAVERMRVDVENSASWLELVRDLDVWSGEYQGRHGEVLLMPRPLQLVTKSLDSIILKSYRRNVSENLGFPEEPEDGWLVPDNWHRRMKDLVRTTVVVRFLDGVEFVARRAEQLAVTLDIEPHSSLEARFEGYYAAQLHVQLPMRLPAGDVGVQIEPGWLEMQVTTQLKDVIQGLLHHQYASRRLAEERPETDWRWDASSEEFASGYLGHILHYVDGAVVTLRDRQREAR